MPRSTAPAMARTLYTIMFVLGGVLVLAGSDHRRRVPRPWQHRVLAVVTIVLALLPIIGAIVLRLAAVGSF